MGSRKCIYIFVMCFSSACLQNLKDHPNDIPNFRIIGGNIVSPHSIPYQAFLHFTGENSEWSCGGSLITRNYVLTAARCCYGANIVEVILGAHIISNDESTQIKLESNNITIHPNFKTDVEMFVYENDIALIHLPNPVTLNDVIKTVILSSSNYTYVNQTGKVTGWGLTDGFNNESYAVILLAQENTIISNEVCSLVYIDLKEYDICMEANDTTSPCEGDYGSPLVVGGVQVGVVSQGVMYCIPGYPFIHTRVSSFLEWIMENSDYEDNGDATSTIPSTNEPTVSTVVSSASTSSSTSPAVPTINTTTVTISTTTSSGNSFVKNLDVYVLVALFICFCK